MTPDEHRRHQEDLAAYILDALSPDETRAFEQHLAACPACQAEERWLRGAIELLPSSVEQFEPPPTLREELMETVRAESARELPRPRRRRGLSLPSRSTSGFRAPLRPVSAALAAVALLGAGVLGYVLGDEGGVSTRTVAARSLEPRVSALASVVESGDAALLRIDRLPPLKRGRVYEVWLDRGKRGIQPSSLFVVRRDGRGSAAIPDGLDGVRAVMVTQEPEGGSAQPSSMPLLRAAL
jgi:anti-sigma factor RsiW